MYEQWQIDPTSSQGGPLSSGTSSISHELHNTIHNTEVEQPRSQGPLLPIPWSKSERETLENVGHVYPRTWEMTKHNIAVSYTHLPSPRDLSTSRMPSSA